MQALNILENCLFMCRDGNNYGNTQGLGNHIAKVKPLNKSNAPGVELAMAQDLEDLVCQEGLLALQVTFSAVCYPAA